MKAAYFQKTGDLSAIQWAELDLPRVSLKEGELRLKFLAGSLNHLDLWVIKGLPNLRYQFPHIAGADVCAEVIETRSTRFKEGDQVILYPAVGSGKDKAGRPVPENLSRDFSIRGESFPGVFCEEIVENEKYVFAKPAHLKIEEAAALPLVYLTAWQMLSEKAGISENWDEGPVLVHAAGSGVSQALLEFLLAMKVPQIALTSRSKEKLEIWESRGVKGFVWSDKVLDELRAFTNAERFSVIFDHVGAYNFDLNIKLLRNGGRWVSCGATSGYQVQLDLRQIFFRQLQLIGSTMGSLRHFQEVLAFVNKMKIKPQLSKIYSIDEIQKAYLELDAGIQNGKIVVKAMN